MLIFVSSMFAPTKVFKIVTRFTQAFTVKFFNKVTKPLG